MMAAVLGKIEEFDRRKEDWDLYIERLEHFFVANAITEPVSRKYGVPRPYICWGKWDSVTRFSRCKFPIIKKKFP